MCAGKAVNSSGNGAWKGIDVPPHLPVMVDEVVEYFSHGLESGLMVDGTAGVGGHLARLRNALPKMEFLALDRDPAAVSLLRSRFSDDSRITVVHAAYSEVPELLRERGMKKASAAMFDLGLSSLQLDDRDRGFSYRTDGSLDMRFDTSAGRTAEDLVNSMPEKDLADIIYRFGQEGRSRRIARAIVESRPVSGSRHLADIISGSVRSSSVKILSRVFQALRIAVNGEMDQLDDLIDSLGSWTEHGARVAFLTFHSIEDRKVKILFRDSEEFRQHSPKWLVPGEKELERNSRARSARLRMGVRE